MRTINISTASRHQWLGQDLLIMQNPNNGPYSDRFDYTALAATKVVTYAIAYSDLFKIPQKIRDQMCAIARTRKQVILDRTLVQFKNLKAI